MLPLAKAELSRRHMKRGRQNAGSVPTAASPGTIRNLRANPSIEVNFVDPSCARVIVSRARPLGWVERGEAAFDTLLPNLRSALSTRIRAIVTIVVTKALPRCRRTGARAHVAQCIEDDRI
jgi:hypothetical protein